MKMLGPTLLLQIIAYTGKFRCHFWNSGSVQKKSTLTGQNVSALALTRLKLRHVDAVGLPLVWKFCHQKQTFFSAAFTVTKVPTKLRMVLEESMNTVNLTNAFHMALVLVATGPWGALSRGPCGEVRTWCQRVKRWVGSLIMWANVAVPMDGWDHTALRRE